MRHAVLQTDLRPPDHGQLLRAFEKVPGLTRYDATILGRDAFGVLVKDFSAEQAAALQGALRVEGVETEIVEQTRLPEMPPTKLVHRLECQPEHLLIYDPLGNSFPLPWRHVLLIAAGAVRLNEFVRQRKPREVMRVTGRGHLVQETEFETVTREERNFHLLGEIIISGAALRYSFTADRLLIHTPPAARAESEAANFGLFVRELIRHSPHAGLNRGASSLAREAPEIFSYPSKNAFHEEIVWMLWQAKKLT
jgi:hypothetical protein